ncbi:DUF7010 family protein [Butyrivibrio sp. WCD2001]|uniref:DUF7010 family protein n=1 Tax=Butyrivibrio sp. WCD2001 TaxID=1280681 RepID=UPI0009DBFD78|nr:hypothetical protein [Butyrivibrio sp. WCD2001]
MSRKLPFILASVIIWTLILIVTCLDLPLNTRNLLVFCCSWLYKSAAYRVVAIALPIMALIVGHIFSATVLAAAFAIVEVAFSIVLFHEVTVLSTEV